jgi:hypothetical protein
MKRAAFIALGVALMMFGVWSAFYSFHIWPEEPNECHWYTLPHIVTAVVWGVVWCVLGSGFIAGATESGPARNAGPK